MNYEDRGNIEIFGAERQLEAYLLEKRISLLGFYAHITETQAFDKGQGLIFEQPRVLQRENERFQIILLVD